MKENQVTLFLNGEPVTAAAGTTLEQLAKAHRKEYGDDILLAVVNHRLQELHHSVAEGSEVTFVTAAEKNGRMAYQRSLIFLMQRAVDRLEPEKNIDIRVMFPLDQSYFCRVYTAKKTTEYELDPYPAEERIAALEAEMRRLVEEDLPITKTTERTRAVRALFAVRGLVDKERLMRYRISSTTNLYELDGLKDYFYGYMVPSTGYLHTFALTPFQDGFLLRYPYPDGHSIPSFTPSLKSFEVLNHSGSWSEQLQIGSVGALDDAIAAGRTREIVLVQEALMEQQIGMIADRIAKEGRRCIMIAGPSSSGKTTFSHRLSTQLRARGLAPHPVPLDNYYRGRELIPVDENGEKDFESMDALDVPLFNENMTDLLAGKRVDLPIYNFKTGRRQKRGTQLRLGSNDVLVIEGIHGLNSGLSYSIPDDSKYKIYISALSQLAVDEHNPMSTTDGRLIRRIVRDARPRGTIAKDTIAMWDSVRRGEEKYIFPFREEADEMFNSALIYEMSVLKLYAEPLLFGIPSDCPEYAEAIRLLKLLDYFLPMPTEDIANNSLIREFIGGSCFDV